jgi:hypothetical protein
MKKLLLLGFFFMILISFKIESYVFVPHTATGFMSTLGGLDPNWYLSTSSATDLSTNATVIYVPPSFVPSYPTTNSTQLSRFIGTPNNSTSNVVNNPGDPIGNYFFNTILQGTSGNLNFEFEADNALNGIFINGVSLFSTQAVANAYIAAHLNVVNSANQYTAFNGVYTLSGLNAGDIISFRIRNTGTFANGNGVGFRLVSTPEPSTYLMLGSMLMLGVGLGAIYRKKAPKKLLQVNLSQLFSLAASA